MSSSPVLATVPGDTANSQFYPSHEGCVRFEDQDIHINDNDRYRGWVGELDKGGYTYLPLHTFLAYYPSYRSMFMREMVWDFMSIIHSLEDFKSSDGRMKDPRALSDDQLKRIERALHRLFPELQNNPINRTAVTDKVVQKLFPALIPDSPFTSSEKLNRSLVALPFQITELFLRTIVDCIASLALSAYAFKDADMAEYLKARLSITHNNSARAIWTNIYSHVIIN